MLSCFKAYDIRGKVGTELTEEIAWRIGYAFAQFIDGKQIVVGGDMRLSTPALKAALIAGINATGCDVIDLGLTGTEEVYFATFHLKVDGGVQVTASHNPIDYNGMKFVGPGATPLSGDSGLKTIEFAVENAEMPRCENPGKIIQRQVLAEYIQHLLGYIDSQKITPIKIVVNSGNGVAGHVIDALETQFKLQNVPVTFIKVHHEPNGHFPNGIPNPLLPENRSATALAVLEHQADLGIAWDGDFDRCFLFDEQGQFIEGYYIVGLLAEIFLRKSSKEKIIHDPRLAWNTIDIVTKAGGTPVQAKTGHAFIKERMRLEDAVYGGEMSAHHYFRDFAYCDSGMIPWLLIVEWLSIAKLSLSTCVAARMEIFPCSGELNYKVQDVAKTIEHVTNKIMKDYEHEFISIDHTDGVSLEFESWRMNLRGSNTEPLLRLNLESRGDVKLVETRVGEIESLIENVSKVVVVH